ncbi:metallophosphoesterase [Marispirochaeta sp.]|jgi:predicted phosphodiesterase|uniref:metallophosphoesterase n=1 Tax=Marispirochaeta sp. TaxID=2038653 RepID=UPI0029C635D8|nr:metallophosphoesterase [Marispirochaeta sp.]
MGIQHIKKATQIVNTNQNRLTDSYGNPGGLIDLSKNRLPVIVIGDLHGAVDNLAKIVEHEGNDKALKNGKAILVIIGDSVHNDQTGYMKEMESSYKILELTFKIINTYKDSVIYIRGNHDTFDERISKSGIRQGAELQAYLEKNCGKEYVKATEEFFESLPYFIIGDTYVITHAGPIRNGASRNELINIADNEDYRRQLVWNRVHEFRGTPSLKEYGAEDIKKMLEKLKMPPESYFIVGHNPMWHTGNLTGIWWDVTGIKNHIILYTNIGTRAPYLYIEDGKVEKRFAVAKQREGFYV